MKLFFATASAASLLCATSAQRQPSKSKLSVGMLFVAPEGTQYLDTGGIDMFALMSPSYVKMIGTTKEISDKAVNMDFHFISKTGNSPMNLTGDAKLVMSVSRTVQMHTMCLMS
jgi:hypothetical protein